MWFSNSESWGRGSNRPIDMQPAVNILETPNMTRDHGALSSRWVSYGAVPGEGKNYFWYNAAYVSQNMSSTHDLIPLVERSY